MYFEDGLAIASPHEHQTLRLALQEPYVNMCSVMRSTLPVREKFEYAFDEWGQSYLASLDQRLQDLAIKHVSVLGGIAQAACFAFVTWQSEPQQIGNPQTIKLDLDPNELALVAQGIRSSLPDLQGTVRYLRHDPGVVSWRERMQLQPQVTQYMVLRDILQYLGELMAK